MIRGWFSSGPAQAALDDLIKKARGKPIPSQSQSTGAEIQEIVASITDGVGAQSIAVRVKQSSKTVLAMILIKAGHGIRDSFLVPLESSGDAEQMIGQLRAETGADDISADTLRVLLEGALADGLANECLPAPGFLDVVESCNLFDLRPQELGLQALLDLADPNRKIQDASAQALGRWINDDMALDFLEPLTDSWFEDSQETREIVATGKTARSIETKLWKFLETRRDIWARRFLQTAVMLRDGDRLREWKTLTASAYVLHQHNLVSVGEVDVTQIAQEFGVVSLRAPVGYFHMAASLKRCEAHEQVGRAAAAIFIVEARRASGTHRDRRPGFGHQLL